MRELEQLLLSEAPDAYVLMDTDGKVLYWNRCAEQIFGYTHDEVLGKSISDFIVPAERLGEEDKVFRETLVHGRAECESIRCRKDGALLYLSVSNKLLLDEQGRPQYVLSCKRDISAGRVQRDASLIAARFHGLLESMPDGIVMVNSLGRIVLANSQAGKLFGWDPQELRGHPIEVLLPMRLRHAHVGHRSAYFVHSRTRAMGAGLDLSGLRKDGSEFPVEISLSPLEVEGEIFALSAVRDISERKRIEQVLSQKNRELEKAAEAKNRFLANVSHELRTPLNAIMGFTDILLQQTGGALSQEQQLQLQVVQSNSTQLLSLINDMLDLTRIEASEIILSPEPVLCSDLLREIGDAFTARAAGKSLAIRFDLCTDEKAVMADRKAFEKILDNLVSNAIKFTDAGHVTLMLRQSLQSGCRTTRLTVLDTGCGIRDKDLPRLFQPLTQLDASASRKHEGTGLGLCLSQKLARLIPGKIEVESVFGKGSRFTLEFSESITQA